MTSFEQQGEPRTSVLLHASSFSTNDKLWDGWDLLPVFVTPRTLFFLPFNAAGKSVDQFDEHDRDEYYRKMTLIYGSLGKKAKELHGKLTDKGLTNDKLTAKELNEWLLRSQGGSDVPYPKATILGTHEGTLSPSDEKLMIEKLAINKCDLTDTELCHVQTTVVNLTIRDDITVFQSKVKKFVVRLEIPTPFAWELFRKIFSYATRSFEFIELEKVATIAVLCGITCHQFPSVLNFYHQHGAFLYFSDVKYLNKIVIVKPDWLYKNLQCLLRTSSEIDADPESKPMWDHLKKHGILVPSLGQSVWPLNDRIPNLALGMIDLMNKFNLAVEITVPLAVSTEANPKYFVPFVLESSKDAELSPIHSVLEAAPLHFIFETTKYVPPGAFIHFAAALLGKSGSTEPNFRLDFHRKAYRDRISYRYKDLDYITIYITPTSICALVKRLKNCDTHNYDTLNFGCTSQDILSQLSNKLSKVVLESLPSVEKCVVPTLLSSCSCDESPHYVKILVKTDTNNICEKTGHHVFNSSEQFWLNKARPSKHVEEYLNDNEITALIDTLGPKGITELMQALEIKATGPDYFTTLKRWSTSIHRKYFVYHLSRLGRESEARKIEFKQLHVTGEL